MGSKEGARKGREKGKRWERQFARELSLWWSEGEDKDIFRRTFGSRSIVEADSQARDIMAVKGEGYRFTSRYDIELKNCKIDLWKNFLKGEKAQIYQWWDQAEREKKENKQVFLVIKSNWGKPLVVIGELLYQHLLSFFGSKFSPSLLKWRVLGDNRLFIFPWEEWKKFDPRLF